VGHVGEGEPAEAQGKLGVEVGACSTTRESAEAEPQQKEHKHRSRAGGGNACLPLSKRGGASRLRRRRGVTGFACPCRRTLCLLAENRVVE
jgi:hypothetical protein